MCLLFVYVNPDPGGEGYRLIIASNRDELWDRPTDTAAFRDEGKWIGGMDLEPGREGGSWLGISKTGRVAALLNILAVQDPEAKGRGSLVRDFLTSDVLCEDYLAEVSSEGSQYNPFHLLLLDLRQTSELHCLSYCKQPSIKTLPPGVHGADNNKDLVQVWKKREAGQQIFSDIINKHGHTAQHETLSQKLFDLLNDRTQYFPDECLAKAFEDVGRESTGDLITQRSAVFVFSPQVKYGTRTNTVILLDNNGNCDYIERTYVTPIDLDHPKWTMVYKQFKVDC